MFTSRRLARTWLREVKEWGMRVSLVLCCLVAGGCSTSRYAGSEADIKRMLLQVTPLGASQEVVRQRVATEIKPVRVNFEKMSPGFVLYADLGKVDKRPPLPFFFLSYTQVDGRWVFDSSGRLINVFVHKQRLSSLMM